MRRALLAVTLGGVLLSAAACDSGTEAPAAAPVTTTTAAAPVITSPAPDYSENTKLVCGKVQSIFNTNLQNFATQMGKMIAYKQAKQTAEAETAEKAAAAQLKDVATKVRKETAAAEDPELKTAGETSAAKFARSAADGKYFDSIKSDKDLNKTIEAKMTDWLSPVAGYCR